ncbi:hypothetical protein MKZ38_002749 [Zalerion maritima]|uniref:Uncharacterized protein n=1 Tax=Zalerion maritima TaxID=339359 RepID=A0AAD5RV78_9PEZI|nr:hypothetical protein MKZ38_002749 [Zalerion maritima]
MIAFGGRRRTDKPHDEPIWFAWTMQQKGICKMGVLETMYLPDLVSQAGPNPPRYYVEFDGCFGDFPATAGGCVWKTGTFHGRGKLDSGIYKMSTASAPPQGEARSRPSPAAPQYNPCPFYDDLDGLSRIRQFQPGPGPPGRSQSAPHRTALTPAPLFGSPISRQISVFTDPSDSHGRNNPRFHEYTTARFQVATSGWSMSALRRLWNFRSLVVELRYWCTVYPAMEVREGSAVDVARY